jgi:hypothetical protein
MRTGCCTEQGDRLGERLHDQVPVVTQYATADLIARIAYEGHSPGDDPAWRTSGAEARADYARWCGHMCGIACLRMALLHRDGHAPAAFQLLAGARDHGAYVETGDGTIRGLIYAPFARYALAVHALPAEVHADLSVPNLLELLGRGRLVMASVSKDIRHPERDPESRGGHLVLLVGHRDGLIHLRNPSGHTPDTRRAALPVERFAAFFAGRGVSLDLCASEPATVAPSSSADADLTD